MIYTCTLNPSLDYYLEASKTFKAGIKNRSELEYYEAGGKGINVSIVLNNLMIRSQAMGFLGGFTRDFYITLLEKYSYIRPNFNEVEGHTRINVKLMDHSGTDINASGPYLSSQNLAMLSHKLTQLCEGDYFVFSGNAPCHLTEEICIMLTSLIEEGIHVVIDSSSNIIQIMKDKKPFLIRTSNAQLQELYPSKSVMESLKEMQQCGVIHTIVTECGNAYLAMDSGIYHISLQTEEIVNNVGTSDAMVAGFLMNYIRSHDALDSFRFGACCNVATAYSKGMATRDKINQYYSKKIVTKQL